MIKVVITAKNSLMLPRMEQQVQTVLKRTFNGQSIGEISIETKDEHPVVASSITVQIDLSDVNWGDIDQKWAWSFIRRSTVKKFKKHGGARVTQAKLA